MYYFKILKSLIDFKESFKKSLRGFDSLNRAINKTIIVI